MKEIDEFKNKLIDFREIKKSTEKLHKLHKLSDNTTDYKIKEYKAKRMVGISEWYYHGPSHSIEWMIGIEMFDKKTKFAFERLYIFSPDTTYRTNTKKEFIKHLKEQKVLTES